MTRLPGGDRLRGGVEMANVSLARSFERELISSLSTAALFDAAGLEHDVVSVEHVSGKATATLVVHHDAQYGRIEWRTGDGTPVLITHASAFSKWNHNASMRMRQGELLAVEVALS